jgi:hypothetical protein
MMQAVNSADQLSPSMGASASSSMNGLQPAASGSSGQIPGASAASSAVSDFPNKMTSLGEVQRIIGLSLSKIQMGRNQRGGLPLHKNLLVATVLNKARDLYMQETMYMNYKMMTGQFAAAAASATNNANNNHGMQEQMHSAHQHYHNYGNIAVANAMTHVHHDMADDDMEPVEANEADYDEDSESDVEDDCDVTSVQTASANADTHTMTTNHMQYPPTTMASMLSLHMHMQQQQQQMQQHELQQQQQQQQQTQTQQPSPEQPAAPILPAAVMQPQHSHQQPPQQQSPPPPPQPPAVVNTNDEGFIDEPDCDCDARNFSTSESRVPFQYCYNCAPFHPSNGRGPTLVPSPCPSPTPTATSSSKAGEAGGDSGGVCNPTSPIGSCNPVLYDMDSQSTEVGSKIPEAAGRGTKRRCSSSDSLEEEDGASKKRRESTETSPDTSRDESGYLSDSSQHEVSLTTTPLAWNSPRALSVNQSLSYDFFLLQMFHPAFRGTTCSTNTNSEILAAPSSSSGTCTAPTGAVGPGQTMEIDQITSLVSIFSFGQHIMAAAAAANSSNVSAAGVSITNTTNTTSSSSEPKAEVEAEEEKKEKKSESSEDSDSESDTSSDSGHSSDDHEAAKEEEQASAAASTKLTRSVSTPDLCATSAAASVASNTMASEAPPCVEVASL